jgi:hypothetical protein
MSIANKTYLKAKEELEELEELNMQMDEEKQSKYLVIYTKLDDFGRGKEVFKIWCL